jgi:hypothetical protein
MGINRISILMFFISILLAAGMISAQAYTGCQAATTTLNGVVRNIAPWYCSTINVPLQNVWANWLPLLIIVIMLSFAIATIFFIIGVAFKNDRLRTFGVGEIYEAFATTIIVAFFAFIAAVMFGLLPAITAGPIDPYNAALSYIATTINTTTTTTSSLFNLVALSGFYYSIGFQTDAFGGEVRTPPVLDVFSFLITYYFFWPAWSIVVFLVEALFSLYTQFYMILFIMYSAVPVFLIPGIVFRAILPTRQLGAMMIAVAIGFYFVMPTLFAVAYYYTSNNIVAQLTLTNGIISRYGQNANFVQDASSAQAPLALAVGQIDTSFSSYWLSILFFPALIIAVTYSMVTQIAEVIGGMSKGSSRLRALV